MEGRVQGTITILIARFDDLFALGLRTLLATDPSIEVVATDIEQSRIPVVISAHHPDVAILDLDALPRPAAVRELCASHPETRLVLFSRDAGVSISAPLLAFGASACLDMGTQSRDVLNALHLAARGLQVAPGATPARSGGPTIHAPRLTPREAELLPMLQRGDTNAQIALALGVGVETVRTHAHNLYGKLGVSSRRALYGQTNESMPSSSEQQSSEPRVLVRSLTPRARRGHELRR
jgi:DNA-binding NarL/FixJ family response regulator